MNQELANVIRIYTTGTHKELSEYLIGKSKDNLIAMLVDLLRLKRDKKENLNILVSGFIDGKLIYIIEFPFNCPSFVKCLE
jgi:hypothetical protein